MMPFAAMKYRMAAGSSAPTLYDEIMADGPVNYWRNGEANTLGGMIDEVAIDGSYVGFPNLGNTPIYATAGAPTCVGGNFTNVRYGSSAQFPAALNAITIVTVVRLNSTSGFQPIGVQRDDNGGGSNRKYQLRSNGTSLEFVKIVGGVTTITQTSVFTAGVTALIGITIDSSGNYVMYKNGVSIKTGTIAAANYGGSGDQYQIGHSTGMGAQLNGFTCENAVFNYALSGARMAAYATAAGL